MNQVSEINESNPQAQHFKFNGFADYSGNNNRPAYGSISRKQKATIPVGEGLRVETSIDVNQFSFTLSQKVTHQQYRDTEKTKQEFDAFVKTWIKATAHYSLTRQQIIHPSFLRIIGMGERVLPLILEELKQRPIVGWFTALQAITGKDVASDATSIKEAAQCWLEWGEAEGYR